MKRPEPFKQRINYKVIEGVAYHLGQQAAYFDQKGFIHQASLRLEQLELKQRTQQLTQALYDFLPDDYEQSLEIITQSLGPVLGPKISGGDVDASGIGGWALMSFADYVGLYGQAYFEPSMQLLQEITRRGSSEFAIRYFLRDNIFKTLETLETWISHEDHHVRRLVSEGTRPRLPWGFQLKAIIQAPDLTLPLLKALREDASEYVRRSVANHYNDLSKDHPNRVIEALESQRHTNNISQQRLMRHACRTLLKNNHPDALALFGLEAVAIKTAKISLESNNVILGDDLIINLSFELSQGHSTEIMLDYKILFKKANGDHSGKAFKWKRLTCEPNQLYQLTKKQSFRLVTTRVYYTGQHFLQIYMNGQMIAETDFVLLEDRA